MLLSGEQEKESVIHVRMRYKYMSLAITICHHSARPVMPIGEPRDGFFCPTLTLMMVSYIESSLVPVFSYAIPKADVHFVFQL